MRDVVILFVHLIVTVVRLARPGGFRSVVAESVLAKHQLQILNRSRKRARNLRAAERLIAGLCNLFMNPARVLRSAIVLKPSTLLLVAAGVWASQTICDAVRIKARLSTTENDFLTLSRLMGSNLFLFVEGSIFFYQHRKAAGGLASRPSLLTQPFYCAAGRDFGMLLGSSAGTGFSGC